jgi:hypothetical protein
MHIAPAMRVGRSFALASIFRSLWQYPERRYQRTARRRAEWIYEAQHAPTVQERIDREWIASHSQ